MKISQTQCNVRSDVISLKTVAFEMNKASPTGEGYDADCVTQIITKGASEDHISIGEATKHGVNDVRASKFCGRSLQNGTLTGTDYGVCANSDRSLHSSLTLGLFFS